MEGGSRGGRYRVVLKVLVPEWFEYLLVSA